MLIWILGAVLFSRSHTWMKSKAEVANLLTNFTLTFSALKEQVPSHHTAYHIIKQPGTQSLLLITVSCLQTKWGLTPHLSLSSRFASSIPRFLGQESHSWILSAAANFHCQNLKIRTCTCTKTRKPCLLACTTWSGGPQSNIPLQFYGEFLRSGSPLIP